MFPYKRFLLFFSYSFHTTLDTEVYYLAMFEYLNSGDVVTRMDTIATGIYHDLRLIERHPEGSDG